MKRKIALYINGSRADLQDTGLVLYNYAFTDNDNPTAVKNSFSKQITLPGTAANAAIFGHISRLDRITAVMGGKYFDPMTETPFEIRINGDEVLESGYLRLDSVLRDGRIVKGYKVTLFGGLGSFFYSLAYDASGNKKTLASLDYLGSANPDAELDFQIYASAVSSAWARLASDPSAVSQIWDVVNFAPAYNGIPEGDFAADKGYGNRDALAAPSQSGYFPDASGNILVKFPAGRDEWAVKDLRSYLQRPVLSWRAFLQAVARPGNNGGYTFDYSDIPEAQYRNLWKTLPMIPSIGSFRRASGSLTGTRGVGVTSSQLVNTITLSGVDSFVGLNINSRVGVSLTWWGTFAGDYSLKSSDQEYCSIAFVQIVGYAGGTKVAGSKVVCLGPTDTGLGAKSFALIKGETGFRPEWDTEEYEYRGTALATSSINSCYAVQDVFLDLAGTGYDSIRIFVKAFYLRGFFTEYAADIVEATDLQGSAVAMWNGVAEVMTDSTSAPAARSGADSYTYETPASLRSGTLIGKAQLLSSQHTPAEYLIGWAKMNGFVFLCEPARRVVRLLRRDTFFNWQSTDFIDLSGRLDTAKEVTISPLYASARWYEFSQPVAEGAFAKEYKDIYGIDYGIQKVNTGYAFDASVKKVLDNLPFSSAAPVLAHGVYWNIAMVGGVFRPSVLIDAGNKYTLWDGSGTAKEFDLPALDANLTALTYYNPDHPGYDLPGISRLQFADKDGKGSGGDDVLCWFLGRKAMPYFQLTDDTTPMVLANDGTPCWQLTGATSTGILVPTFSRYKMDGAIITDTLDFGRTKELDIPAVAFANGSITLYEKRWRAFLADRLDRDTKVMKCRVDFSGFQVGPSLLRRFFYYEGSYWVLNKITNYSLTTWDPVECEFIQVRDMAHYYNGQIM